MLHFIKNTARACAVLCVSATVAFAAPVLTNGGFEDNPPVGFGNNIPHPITPWVLGPGDSANVVKVDDGGRNYGPHGPQFDATNPGVGIDQHYLDIADGSNDFYQEFTPLCGGRVEYGAYFSRRPSGPLGVAGITLLKASDDSVAEARQTTSLPHGVPRTDPWTRVAYQTTLVANTAYKFYVDMDNDMNIDNAFVVFLDQCDLHDDPDFTTGVPVELTQTIVTKTCTLPEAAETGLSSACTITVTHGDEPFDGLQIEEAFNGPNGSQTTLISSLTSDDPWVCSAVPPASDLDAVTCNMAGGDIVAGSTTTIDVVLDLSGADAGDFENCAQATGMTDGEQPAGTAQVDNAVFYDLEPSCAPIVIKEEDVVADPKPFQCTPFKAEVTCNETYGGYEVVLANSLTGTFDPNLVQVDILSAGVSAISNANNPLRMRLIGANPGDTVLMSIAATEQGGGSQDGLDLCCMGDVNVTVPDGLMCDPPKGPQLSVSKSCEPTAQGFGAGNTVCHMDVTYSGPPPAPANPIVISDGIVAGSGVISINAQDPTGATNDVWACGGFGAGPVSCEMHNGIDATPTAGYWDSYSTTLDLYLDADETYRNCATASLTLEDGTVVKAEDCHSVGDTQLEIVKSALFDICIPGEVCQFEYTVNNVGSADYNGAITLNDIVTPIGGQFTAISPALCDPADLTSVGCTGTANVLANGSVTYVVDYIASNTAGPVAADLPQSGENCVLLSDENMGPFDDPSDVDGHKSCTQFQIGAPNLSIAKVLDGDCLPGAICNFEIQISSQGAAYDGNIVLAEGMGGTGGMITNVTPALPASCALPIDTVTCVVPVSVPANGTYTLSVEATYDAIMDGEGHNRNCVIAMTVPSSVPVGSFDANEEPEWASQAVDIGQVCVDFDPAYDLDCADTEVLNDAGECVPASVPELSVEKTCDPTTLSVSQGEVSYLDCTLTVTAQGYPDGTNILVTDTLTGGGAAPIFHSISNIPGWPCNLVGRDLQCSLNSTDLNANGGSLSAEVVFGISNALAMGDMQNCLNAVDANGITAETSCVGINVVEEQDDVVIDPPVALDVAVAKSGRDYQVERQTKSFLLYPSLVSGTLLPGDVVILRDDMVSGLVNFATTSTQGQWTCVALNSGQGRECIATVGATGTMPTPSPLINGRYVENQWENCARIEVRRNGVVVSETNTANNLSCVSGDETPDDVAPVLELTKQCQASPRFGNIQQYQCIINVTSDGTPFAGDLVVTDEMTIPSMADANLTVIGIGAPAPWVCAIGPHSATNPAACSIDAAGLGSLQNTSSVVVFLNAPANVFDEAGAQNCAVPTIAGQPAGDAGCHVFSLPVVDQDDDGFPAGEDCDDLNNQVFPGAPDVADGIDNDCDNLVDEDVVEIDADMDGFPASEDCDDTDPSVFPGAQDVADNIDNDCDGDVDEDAVVIPDPSPKLPFLTPAKSLQRACVVNKAAQTYTCDFELTVTNTGGAPFKGPIALDDSFGAPKPTSLTTSGAGWECMRTDGLGSSCLIGSASLEPGQSTSLVMTTVIPSSPTGAKFDNCVAVGISQSDFLRASVIQTVMQRLGIDGGPVDGAPGRKTRQGIRQLQERLGQAPTGEIDDALFAAVGLPSAVNAEKVCITVDLPPVERPVRCAPPKVKNSKGVCYTPRVDTPSKECRSGQRLNSKGQCYTPDVSCPQGQKQNSKGQCYTPKKATSCDSRSTVQRGEGCACRYSNMRKTTARACVCRNTGLAPIRGVGCPSIKTGGESDSPDGGGCKLLVNGICLKR